jgi:REP element-mobilizing transposase RayT
MGHPPRIPVWLKWDQEIVYFLTFCVAGRKRVLAHHPGFAAFQNAIRRLAKWSVIAAILMPDHIHLLIAPKEREEAVGNASGAIKRWMRVELDADWQWQPGSFDRLLRSDESAWEKWQYSRKSRPCRVSEDMGGLALSGRVRSVMAAAFCRAGAPPASFPSNKGTDCAGHVARQASGALALQRQGREVVPPSACPAIAACLCLRR